MTCTCGRQGKKKEREKWCSFLFGRHCGPEGGKTPRTREGPFLCFSIGFGGRHAELEAQQAMFLFFFFLPLFFCCTGEKHRAGVSRMRCAVFFSSPFFTLFVTSPSPPRVTHLFVPSLELFPRQVDLLHFPSSSVVRASCSSSEAKKDFSARNNDGRASLCCAAKGGILSFTLERKERGGRRRKKERVSSVSSKRKKRERQESRDKWVCRSGNSGKISRSNSCPETIVCWLCLFISFCMLESSPTSIFHPRVSPPAVSHPPPTPEQRKPWPGRVDGGRRLCSLMMIPSSTPPSPFLLSPRPTGFCSILYRALTGSPSPPPLPPGPEGTKKRERLLPAVAKAGWSLLLLLLCQATNRPARKGGK